jgi:hypothetical protein
VSAFRNLRRRFGIHAPRVAVRAHVSWYWRVLALFLMLALVTLIAWGTFDVGRRLAGFDIGTSAKERERLYLQVRQLQGEVDALRRTLAAAERQIQMESATQESLAQQVKGLNDENATLKEDLAFFQSLMAQGDPGTVVINRFRVEPDALPGEYRYHLFVAQPRQKGKDFQGRLQLVVDTEQGGQPVVVTLPPDGSPDSAAFRLSFRFYQRVEGVFTVPAGAVVRRVHARVIEQGATVSKSTMTLTL